MPEHRTLNELAAASHADATRRGIYPQSWRGSLADIEAEMDEAYEALRRWHATTTDAAMLTAFDDVAEELVDVLLCTLSTLHDLGMDIDAEVARKMAINATRGPRA